jgi:hypothetical protein
MVPIPEYNKELGLDHTKGPEMTLGKDHIITILD